MNKLFTLFIFVAFAVNVQAQVLYDLSFDAESNRYTVSLLPQTTWEFPQNITGSGQITLKTETGLFTVHNLINLQPGVEWLDNARTDAPAEAPDYDYISFSHMTSGTNEISYVTDELTPLFSFENEGECAGKVSLIDNANDPFMQQNKVNIGNSLSVYGAGQDAYAGNVSNEPLDCAVEVEDPQGTSSVTPLPTLGEVNAYPNPAVERLTIDFAWKEKAGEGTLVITDNTGKEVNTEVVDLLHGDNSVEVRVKSLPTGIYFLRLDNAEGISYALGKFVRG